MAKFSFRAENEFDESLTLVRFNENTINEIVAHFRAFLMAEGFSKEAVDDYVPDPFGMVELEEVSPDRSFDE